MQTNLLHAELTNKAEPAKFEALAEKTAQNPNLLQEALDELDAGNPRVKYGCLKLLRMISETNPDLLYPEIDRFFPLLDSENNILKWGAAIIIGNLASVDSETKIDRVLDHYLQPISGPVMITAAKVMAGAGRIAAAKPYLADKIAHAILQVQSANYQTAECRNVASGHAIESFDLFYQHLKKPQPVVKFLQRQLDNPRNAVKRKAAKFLRKHLQTD